MTPLPIAQSNPMPLDRYERIKHAWMDRYGTTEDDWYQFKQQTVPLDVDTMATANVSNHEDPYDAIKFDSYAVEQNHFQFPMQPDNNELAKRYANKARTFLRAARTANAAGQRAAAKKNFEEALFWRTLAADALQTAADIRSKL